MTCAEDLGFVDPFSGSEGWVDRYGTQEVSQFRGAEMIAEKWDISREDMEVFALESHRRALQAIDDGFQLLERGLGGYRSGLDWLGASERWRDRGSAQARA